jgi:hypothetical protein
VDIVIEVMGTLGSTGAVAVMLTVPTKPLHWAKPELLKLIPVGSGSRANGLPMDHSTLSDELELPSL